MNKYNFQTYIDFGASKIRIGVFDYELPKNNLYNQIECISNFVVARDNGHLAELPFSVTKVRFRTFWCIGNKKSLARDNSATCSS